MNAFYDLGSDTRYLSECWAGERKHLANQSARLLAISEANQLGVGRYISRPAGSMKPLFSSEYQHFAFPYELDDEISLDGILLSTAIEGLINQRLPGRKYLASSDPDKCCVVEIQRFTLPLFWTIASGHLNTPFLVFSTEQDEAFFLLDFDMPIQVVGFKPGTFSEEEVTRWRSYFREQWPVVARMYSHYTNLLPIWRNITLSLRL